MLLRVILVSLYMLFCVCIGTKPCKYFQLNSSRFNRQRGIFSKLDIDQDIPARWRLHQRLDDGRFRPADFPVFVKPEWGQNAAGIMRADDQVQLDRIRAGTGNERIRYLIQQRAPESREFEVFVIRHHTDKSRYGVMTVTEVINDSELYPVNSIYSPATRYQDITAQFSQSQRQLLWQYADQMGAFNISRISMRADSTDDLLAGRFHVIEINLFVPLPINLLDPKYGAVDKFRMLCRYMMTLAKITKTRDKALPEKPVFTKIMLYNRQNRLMNFLRGKI